MRLSRIHLAILLFEVVVFIWIASLSLSLVAKKYKVYRSNREKLLKYNSSSIDLKGLEGEIDSLKAFLRKTRRIVSEKTGQGAILSRIQLIAERSNIKYIDHIRPLGEYVNGDMILSLFELSFKGPYGSVMKLICGLEKSSPPFIMREVTFTPLTSKRRHIIKASVVVMYPELSGSR
ncbi:MAG: hypothetical protein H0Z29_07900 [Candidatus Marinimicrobia bacterium]|nr:hypothetical protein [Candidatus Neomarinimicrobiota bacterium]